MDEYGWNTWIGNNQEFYYKLPQFFEISIIQIILIFLIDFKHQMSLNLVCSLSVSCFAWQSLESWRGTC